MSTDFAWYLIMTIGFLMGITLFCLGMYFFKQIEKERHEKRERKRRKKAASKASETVPFPHSPL